ncbi:MAG: glycosyltransferase [Bacteroidetes bacterium]|nr:glycosyltransferase [Bacteroidota bacterium]
MKILQLTLRIPYPLNDGGAQAMYHMGAQLEAAGHEVTLAALNTRKHYQDPSVLHQVAAVYIAEVDTTPRPWAALWNLLFSRQPYNIQRFDQPAFHDLLRNLLQRESFDLIQLEGVYLAVYLPTLRKYSRAPVVLRAHNVEYRIWERMAGAEHNLLRRTYFRHLARRGRRFEAQMLPRFDGIAAITPEDARQLSQLAPGVPVQPVPSGYTPPPSLSETEPALHSLCFLGSLEWMPNVQGLEWFLDHVWGQVLKAHPHAQLHIAGKNPPQKVLYWNFPNVKIHGQVPDAAEFLQRYQVVINPLLSGSGIRVKILEAMGLGKAVVCTSIAKEGILLTSGMHALVADTPEAFAQAVVQLLEQPDRCQLLGAQAQAFTIQNYSWPGIIAQMEALYARLSRA